MTNIEFTNNYDNLQGLLYSFAMKLTRNQTKAEDLIQETACRAYKNRDKFRQGTNFKAWVTTIMRNTFINDYRKNKKRNKLEQPVDSFLFALESHTISNGAETKLAVQEIKIAMDNIGELYQVPFELFYQGYKYDEIAERLNIPIGTVKSRIHFARKKLRDLVEKY